MSDSEIYKESNARIRNRMQFIRELVNRASVMPHMTSEDLSHAREAVSSVDYGERMLFKSLEALHETDPSLAGNIAWAVDHLTGGTLLAASRATLSDSALNAAAHKQAQDARLARQNSAQEIALTNAINKELKGRDPGDRGLAGRILDGVNRTLKDAGHKAVLRDVVGRRLKKMRS